MYLLIKPDVYVKIILVYVKVTSKTRYKVKLPTLYCKFKNVLCAMFIYMDFVIYNKKKGCTLYCSLYITAPHVLCSTFI